jgi:hypothetical protein
MSAGVDVGSSFVITNDPESTMLYRHVTADTYRQLLNGGARFREILAVVSASISLRKCPRPVTAPALTIHLGPI